MPVLMAQQYVQGRIQRIPQSNSRVLEEACSLHWRRMRRMCDFGTSCQLKGLQTRNILKIRLVRVRSQERPGLIYLGLQDPVGVCPQSLLTNRIPKFRGTESSSLLRVKVCCCGFEVSLPITHLSKKIHPFDCLVCTCT